MPRFHSVTSVNVETGNQVTQYVYGSTTPTSGIASSLLKVAEIYPDSVGGSDEVSFTYNIQGEIVTLTDQNGTVHTYAYDLLGRRTNDCVTTVGTGVDTTVLQIATAYEVRGMVSGVTLYNNATPGSGSIVNDVQLVYNCFAQLTADYQSHAGAVNMATTPVVQYNYANGSTNTIHATTMTYPNGRELNFNYGASGGMNDALSRIGTLIDNDGVTQLANYSYLGLNAVIEVTEPQPGLTYTLLSQVPGNDPVTGDIYQGLDLFSRIKDLIWTSAGGNSSSSSSSSSGAANIVERIQHGYDQAGNRLWRKELADPNELHDELYAYDGIYRLNDLQRGTLNTGKTAVSPETFAQCWGLDATGNWRNFRQDDSGDGVWGLVQGRVSNSVNEITVVNNSAGPAWVTPGYDAAGNMTTMPQPANPGSAFTGTFNAWNQLMTLNASGTQVAGYQYDGMKRRTIKNLYSGGVLSSTRHYFYSSSWQSLEERLGTTTTPDRQLVWGLRYVDDIILRDRDPNGIGTLTERFCGFQDPNWNVTGILNVSGSVEERYGYDAYGNPTVLTAAFGLRLATLWDWETRYAAYRWDGESGLYQVRNRVLHALIEWLQRDPIEGGRPGGSLYQYSFSNPICRVDTSGLQAECCGQEIGPLLDKGLKRVEEVFLAKPQAKKKEICEGIFGIRAWDINQLAYSEGKGTFTKASCGAGGCDGTVTVHKNCFRAGPVNYILWGRIFRLCNRFFWDYNLSRALDVLWIFRTTRYFYRPLIGGDTGTDTRQAWTKVGWYYDYSKAPPNENENCSPCDSVYKNALSFSVGVNASWRPHWWPEEIPVTVLLLVDV